MLESFAALKTADSQKTHAFWHQWDTSADRTHQRLHTYLLQKPHVKTPRRPNSAGAKPEKRGWNRARTFLMRPNLSRKTQNSLVVQLALTRRLLLKAQNYCCRTVRRDRLRNRCSVIGRGYWSKIACPTGLQHWKLLRKPRHNPFRARFPCCQSGRFRSWRLASSTRSSRRAARKISPREAVPCPTESCARLMLLSNLFSVRMPDCEDMPGSNEDVSAVKY